METSLLAAVAVVFVSIASSLFAGGEMVTTERTVKSTEERVTIAPPPYPAELEARYQSMRTTAAQGIYSWYRPVPVRPYHPCAPYGVPGGFGYNGADLYPNIGIGIYGGGPDYTIIGAGTKLLLPGPGVVGFTATP